MRLIVAACVLFALIATPAGARDAPADLAQQTANNLITGGVWIFTAPRDAAEQEETCTEAWVFFKDGRLSVASGEQLVEKTWRIATVDGFELLHTTDISSNSGVDCMGVQADPADYPKPESAGPALMFFQGGEFALVCTPTYAETMNGKMVPLYSVESCWGTLAVIVSEREGEANVRPAKTGP